MFKKARHHLNNLRRPHFGERNHADSNSFFMQNGQEVAASHGASMWYPRFKRACDVFVALTALLTLWPALIATAIAIKLDSPGPAIFRQERLGLGGVPFLILKFRSMQVGSEAQGVYESRQDPRVTRVGRLIRRTSIDELPQLVNILRGEMSVIGPRPALTYHPWPYLDYSMQQRRRFDVRPGVTGWAQVNGRKNVEWPDRLRLDAEYVDRMSLLFDLKIFFKTVGRVLAMSDNHNIGTTASSKSNEDR